MSVRAEPAMPPVAGARGAHAGAGATSVVLGRHAELARPLARVLDAGVASAPGLAVPSLTLVIDPRDAAHESAPEVASDLATLELDLVRAELAGNKPLTLSLERDRKELLARLYDVAATPAR